MKGKLSVILSTQQTPHIARRLPAGDRDGRSTLAVGRDLPPQEGSVHNNTATDTLTRRPAPWIPRWSIVAVCLISTIAGALVFTSGTSLRRAAVYLAVAVAALTAALLTTGRGWWRSPVPLRAIVTIAVVAVAGMAAGLLFREDYFGGSCGEFDWPSGHLHAGYPYSWLDGHICVPPNSSLREYARQNPAGARWYPDLRALAVDLLFWTDVGILASAPVGAGSRITQSIGDRMLR